MSVALAKREWHNRNVDMEFLLVRRHELRATSSSISPKYGHLTMYSNTCHQVPPSGYLRIAASTPMGTTTRAACDKLQYLSHAWTANILHRRQSLDSPRRVPCIAIFTPVAITKGDGHQTLLLEVRS